VRGAILLGFATFFLSLRTAFIVWLFQYIGILIVLLAMQASLELASFPLRFYTVVGGLFQLALFYSRRLDQARQAQLADSHARYHALVENARDLVYTLSATGEMISLNPAFEAVTGWPLDEVTGRSFIDYVDPDYRSLGMAAFQATLAGEKPGPFEVPIRTRSDQYLWIEFNNVPIIQAGQVVAVSGVARVVEERKQLEAALLHSEELYRTLIHHFPEGAVFLFDADLRYQIVDGQALESMGVEKERLEGRTIWKALPPDLISKFEPVYRSALEGNVSIHEMTFGGRVYRVQTAPVSDDRGDIQSGMAVVQDVTSWRSAEDRFRAMFQYSPDAIFLADPETVAIVDCNEVAAQMYVYCRDELFGQRMHVLMPDVLTEDIEDCKRQWQDMTVPQFEMMRRRKDGTTFPVEATTTLIQVAGKQLLLGLERDITSRKQAEAERLQLALEQERLAMLGEFVQAISHEFRNTLSLVETGRYLIERALPEAVRQPITPRLISIQESVARLNEQLNNLNTISSLSNLDYTECDLNQLVEKGFLRRRAVSISEFLKICSRQNNNAKLIHDAKSHDLENARGYIYLYRLISKDELKEVLIGFIEIWKK
jgi:PAS domain S-box-containing protein